jgi:hypothetical protein
MPPVLGPLIALSLFQTSSSDEDSKWVSQVPEDVAYVHISMFCRNVVVIQNSQILFRELPWLIFELVTFQRQALYILRSCGDVAPVVV